MRYLLDTSLISELVAKKPQAPVVAWVDSVSDPYLYLSVITIGEIKRGIAKLPRSERKQALTAWLEDELLVRFRGRILAVTTGVMLRWGTLVAGLEARGRPLPAFDSLIAALALHHDLRLVTRNARDFADTGVTLFNPWPEPD